MTPSPFSVDLPPAAISALRLLGVRRCLVAICEKLSSTGRRFFEEPRALLHSLGLCERILMAMGDGERAYLDPKMADQLGESISTDLKRACSFYCITRADVSIAHAQTNLDSLVTILKLRIQELQFRAGNSVRWISATPQALEARLQMELQTHHVLLLPEDTDDHKRENAAPMIYLQYACTENTPIMIPELLVELADDIISFLPTGQSRTKAFVQIMNDQILVGAGNPLAVPIPEVGALSSEVNIAKHPLVSLNVRSLCFFRALWIVLRLGGQLWPTSSQKEGTQKIGRAHV